MTKPFVFRALSPHHATPMERDYLMRVVEAARKYGYNAIQICGDTHGEGNLDGITEFVKFPRANEVMDLEHNRRVRSILADTCRAAHEFGMEVYYWHHELWYPKDLAKVYPDWFTPAPNNRFTHDLYIAGGVVPRVEPGAPIWEFMDAKFDDAFDQCPELDGTIMTIQEARVPIYCLWEDFDTQVEALIDLYRRLAAAHQRVGKKWVVRTFAWREHEYRVVTEAINRWRSPVPVESKGVAMDWHLCHPYDPLLGKFDGMTKHVEIAPSCEFHGATRHPVGHPWYYTENLRFAGERGHTGLAVRMDRVGVPVLGGPDEGVLACIGAFANDPGVDVGKVYFDWLAERYGLDAEATRVLYDAMEMCWEMTLKTYHQDKIYIGDAFWQRYDRLFFVAERHCCVEPDEPQPLAEKDRAVELADAAAGAIEKIGDKLSPADYEDLRRRMRFGQLTARNYRALVAGIVARWRWIYEPTKANLAALRKAIDDLEAAGAQTSAEFPETGEDAGARREAGDGATPGQRQDGERVAAFARAFRADLPNLKARRIVSRKSAADLGGGSEFRGETAWQPPAEATIELAGEAGKPGVLVIFAGTEMCVRRPVVVRCGQWSHRFDVGQFAWFLAHDRVRRYEAPIPAECFVSANPPLPRGAVEQPPPGGGGSSGEARCTLELTCPEPELSPYIREIRMEVKVE